MTISISCKCGRKINAADKYAGKKVRCPDCSDIIQVPEQPPTAPSTSDNIIVKCNCGKQISAKPELAGKAVRCPDCKNVVRIPTSKPESKPQSLSGDLDKLTLKCSCSKQFAVKSELVGKAVRCPGCQKVVRIPAPKSESISPYLNGPPSPTQDNFLDDILDDESDPLCDSVTLSNMAPVNRRHSHSFELKWIWWVLGGTAALIAFMAAIQSLLTYTPKIADKVKNLNSSSKASDNDEVASDKRKNDTQKSTKRTQSFRNGKRYLKRVPEVEKIINEIEKRAVVNRADSNLLADAIVYEIPNLFDLGADKIVRGMEFYRFSERINRIQFEVWSERSYDNTKLRDEVVLKLAFAGNGFYENRKFRKQIGIDRAAQSELAKEVLANSQNIFECAYALGLLASKYRGDYAYFAETQEAKDEAKDQARALVSLQRECLESKNDMAAYLAIRATWDLQDLAKPNRTALITARQKLPAKLKRSAAGYTEFLLDEFGSPRYQE